MDNTSSRNFWNHQSPTIVLKWTLMIRKNHKWFQFFPLQVTIRELLYILVSDPNDSVIKKALDEENNINISDSKFLTLLSLQLKLMSARYKVMCRCEYWISSKSINALLLSWSHPYLKKFKNQSQNAQNGRSSEKSNCIYETYKNRVIPHGRLYIYAKASDME